MNVKNLLALGGLGALGMYLMTREGAQDNEEQAEELLTLRITPAPRIGAPVAALAPSLLAGSVGNTISVTLKNTAVYQGSTVPAPFTYGLALTLFVNSVDISPIAGQLISVPINAGASVTKSWTFDVPWSASGSAQAGAIVKAGNTTLKISNAGAPITAAIVTPGIDIIW